MPISGTLPFYDVSTAPDQTTTVADFTGAAAPTSGNASADFSNETLQDFLNRAAPLLAISGQAEAVSGAAAGADGQIITSGQLSGLANLQRELVARAVDIELGPASPNDKRITKANTRLTTFGEVKFGS